MAPDRISSSRPRYPRSSLEINSLFCWIISLLLAYSEAFTSPAAFTRRSSPFPFLDSNTARNLRPPPGSGYASTEDEKSVFPDTYEPMMEYPGTMRPGRTPENMPYSDLPIGDDDPDPVPWPHFQQIEWHHKFAPPHEHPIPMEEFIDMQGRWATPEMEAAMRAGVRRGVRERQEQEAEGRQDSGMIITDDDDDDDTRATDVPVALGEGMFGQLGSSADEEITAAAVSPKAEGEGEEEEEVGEDEGMEDDLDNFLLDLGLDMDDDEEVDDGDSGDTPAPSSKKASKEEPMDDMDDEISARLDVKSDGGDTTEAFAVNVDDDDDLDLGLDEDDELGNDDGGVSTVPLEDFGGDSDALDDLTEDIFDDGGFDYDDGDFDGGGDDVW